MHHPPKGSPLAAGPETGWNLFGGTLAFPTAVLRESALDHNAVAMREYCERLGVSLAPHGKTTMAPLLVDRQLDHGAWAITAATTWQAATLRAAGVERVLIANEVVVPAEIEWLAASVADGFAAYCYVDSFDGLDIVTSTLERIGATTPLPVLLEVGVPGGRTGARDVATCLQLAEAIAAAPHVVLAGVSGFEGIIVDGPDRAATDLVDEFLDRIAEVARQIDARGGFTGSSEVIVSAGGSAYFDRVVERLRGLRLGSPVRVVLRSGCYLAHDDGDPTAPPRAAGVALGLIPAIEVWGAVLSRPEPTRALVGVGKRDVSHDALLPVAKKVCRRGGSAVEEFGPVRASALNDQHAYLDLGADDPLAVGDLVGFGISHPCTTFDKWRELLLVDDDYNVTGRIGTRF
jgi:D-serine dehydratase